MGRRSRQKQLRRQLEPVGSGQHGLPATPSNQPKTTATGGIPPGLTQVQIAETYHSGPLPDPETLARYGQVMPDLPARIVEMAERQSRHRQKIENRDSWSEALQRLGGLVGSIILSGAVIVLAYRLVENGYQMSGFTAALGTIAILFGALRASVAARRPTVGDHASQRQQRRE